jgi:hypothetical protein
MQNDSKMATRYYQLIVGVSRERNRIVAFMYTVVAT